MNVTANRVELLAAAKRAASIASPSAPLDELRGTLMMADSSAGKLTLSATNLEVSLEQKVACTCGDDDAFVINAGLLEDMLAQLGGETVEFQRKAGSSQVSVRSGQAGYLVSVMERATFPRVEIPFPEDLVVVSGIPSMVKRSAFATGKSSEPSLLKCVNLRFTKEGLRAVGGDGFCLVYAKGDNSCSGNIDLMVPATSVLKLARLCEDKQEYRVGTDGKSIIFLREDFAYSARLVDGTYINTDQVLGSVVNCFTVLTDIPELKAALNAAIAIDQAETIKLTFTGNQIKFQCQSAEWNASTTLMVVPLTGTPQGEYCFGIRQLSSCLHSLSGTVTLGIAQGGMLTLATNDAFYMQTGLRPQAAQAEKPKKGKPKASAEKAA